MDKDRWVPQEAHVINEMVIIRIKRKVWAPLRLSLINRGLGSPSTAWKDPHW